MSSESYPQVSTPPSHSTPAYYSHHYPTTTHREVSTTYHEVPTSLPTSLPAPIPASVPAPVPTYLPVPVPAPVPVPVPAPVPVSAQNGHHLGTTYTGYYPGAPAPTFHNNQPQTNHNQPQTNHNQPQTDHNQPQTNHNQPQTNHKQPQTNHNQPQTNHNQPQANHNQLGYQYSTSAKVNCTSGHGSCNQQNHSCQTGHHDTYFVPAGNTTTASSNPLVILSKYVPPVTESVEDALRAGKTVYVRTQPPKHVPHPSGNYVSSVPMDKMGYRTRRTTSLNISVTSNPHSPHSNSYGPMPVVTPAHYDDSHLGSIASASYHPPYGSQNRSGHGSSQIQLQVGGSPSRAIANTEVEVIGPPNPRLVRMDEAGRVKVPLDQVNYRQ